MMGWGGHSCPPAVERHHHGYLRRTAACVRLRQTQGPSTAPGHSRANRSAPLGMTGLEKLQLRFRLRRGGRLLGCAVVASHPVLLPQTGHQLRYPFAVGLGQECAVFVAFQLVGCQLGKEFPQLAADYQIRYKDRAFLPKSYGKRISELMARLRQKHGMRHYDRTTRQTPAPAQTEPQLKLF